jgi:hypothetical protein
MGSNKYRKSIDFQDSVYEFFLPFLCSLKISLRQTHKPINRTVIKLPNPDSRFPDSKATMHPSGNPSITPIPPAQPNIVLFIIPSFFSYGFGVEYGLFQSLKIRCFITPAVKESVKSAKMSPPE